MYRRKIKKSFAVLLCLVILTGLFDVKSIHTVYAIEAETAKEEITKEETAEEKTVEEETVEEKTARETVSTAGQQRTTTEKKEITTTGKKHTETTTKKQNVLKRDTGSESGTAGISIVNKNDSKIAAPSEFSLGAKNSTDFTILLSMSTSKKESFQFIIPCGFTAEVKSVDGFVLSSDIQSDGDTIYTYKPRNNTAAGSYECAVQVDYSKILEVVSDDTSPRTDFKFDAKMIKESEGDSVDWEDFVIHIPKLAKYSLKQVDTLNQNFTWTPYQLAGTTVDSGIRHSCNQSDDVRDGAMTKSLQVEIQKEAGATLQSDWSLDMPLPLYMKTIAANRYLTDYPVAPRVEICIDGKWKTMNHCTNAFNDLTYPDSAKYDVKTTDDYGLPANMDDTIYTSEQILTLKDNLVTSMATDTGLGTEKTVYQWFSEATAIRVNYVSDIIWDPVFNGQDSRANISTDLIADDSEIYKANDVTTLRTGDQSASTPEPMMIHLVNGTDTTMKVGIAAIKEITMDTATSKVTTEVSKTDKNGYAAVFGTAKNDDYAFFTNLVASYDFPWEYSPSGTITLCPLATDGFYNNEKNLTGYDYTITISKTDGTKRKLDYPHIGYRNPDTKAATTTSTDPYPSAVTPELAKDEWVSNITVTADKVWKQNRTTDTSALSSETENHPLFYTNYASKGTDLSGKEHSDGDTVEVQSKIQTDQTGTVNGDTKTVTLIEPKNVNTFQSSSSMNLQRNIQQADMNIKRDPAPAMQFYGTNGDGEKTASPVQGHDGANQNIFGLGETLYSPSDPSSNWVIYMAVPSKGQSVPYNEYGQSMESEYQLCPAEEIEIENIPGTQFQTQYFIPAGDTLVPSMAGLTLTEDDTIDSIADRDHDTDLAIGDWKTWDDMSETDRENVSYVRIIADNVPGGSELSSRLMMKLQTGQSKEKIGEMRAYTSLVYNYVKDDGSMAFPNSEMGNRMTNGKASSDVQYVLGDFTIEGQLWHEKDFNNTFSEADGDELKSDGVTLTLTNENGDLIYNEDGSPSTISVNEDGSYCAFVPSHGDYYLTMTASNKDWLPVSFNGNNIQNGMQFRPGKDKDDHNIDEHIATATVSVTNQNIQYINGGIEEWGTLSIDKSIEGQFADLKRTFNIKLKTDASSIVRTYQGTLIKADSSTESKPISGGSESTLAFGRGDSFHIRLPVGLGYEITDDDPSYTTTAESLENGEHPIDISSNPREASQIKNKVVSLTYTGEESDGGNVEHIINTRKTVVIAGIGGTDSSWILWIMIFSMLAGVMRLKGKTTDIKTTNSIKICNITNDRNESMQSITENAAFSPVKTDSIRPNNTS